jgi:hypothetical protein
VEVHVNGRIDRSTARGREAWRSVKSGSLGFSIGFMAPRDRMTKREDGIRIIDVLDVYEISATPTPMNAETRVVSFKGHGDKTPPTLAELRDREEALGLRHLEDRDMRDVRDLMRREVLAHLGGEPQATPKRIDALKRRANAAERDHALDMALAA